MSRSLVIIFRDYQENGETKTETTYNYSECVYADSCDSFTILILADTIRVYFTCNTNMVVALLRAVTIFSPFMFSKEAYIAAAYIFVFGNEPQYA